MREVRVAGLEVDEGASGMDPAMSPYQLRGRASRRGTGYPMRGRCRCLSRPAPVHPVSSPLTTGTSRRRGELSLSSSPRQQASHRELVHQRAGREPMLARRAATQRTVLPEPLRQDERPDGHSGKQPFWSRALSRPRRSGRTRERFVKRRRLASEHLSDIINMKISASGNP